MKTRLIYNPRAGPWDVHHVLQRACLPLEQHGWSIEPRQTERSGDATAMAREAAEAGYDVVLIAGGDGTVNEAVNGLAGTQTALGVLPVGTGNLWARQLGILVSPLRLSEIATDLARGTMRQVDIGQVEDHYFLCWAGIGLDAQVTVEMEPRPRYSKRLGILPYIIATTLVAQDFKGVRTRVYLDSGVVRGRTLLVVASNIQQYAGTLHVASGARMDDGLLDVFVFKGLGFPYVARHVLTMLSRRWPRDPQIVHRRAHYIEVRTEQPVPVQVDGDPIGLTPVTLRSVPRALRVLVPPTAPPELFSQP